MHITSSNSGNCDLDDAAESRASASSTITITQGLHVQAYLLAVLLCMCAGLARAMSAAVMSPVTLVKTRMEYGGPNHIAYKNTAHALATIARTEGPSGLFRGLMPTVLTNAPFSALYYMIYTKLKVTLSTWQSSSSDGSGWNSTAINFVSGVCAATAATLLTQPTDVVRTRMQLGLPGAAKANALSTLGHVLRSSGPNALLTGGLTASVQPVANSCRLVYLVAVDCALTSLLVTQDP